MTENAKHRVVLVGCGGISGRWLAVPFLSQLVEITGFVDLDIEQARKRAAGSAWPDATVGTDLGAMLRKLEPDVVFDCTVPAAHKTVTLTALEHGCHVLGEKPMATSLDDAREMVLAAKAAKRVYAVIQNQRFDARARALAAFLSSGAIGRITDIHVQFLVGAHFAGFRGEMEHVLLADMAIHTFDKARLLCGKNPLEVTALDWNPPGSWYRHGAAANAVFRMTDDVRIVYSGSWCAVGAQTEWTAQWRIVGEKGGVVWDGMDGIQAEEAIPGEELCWKTRPLTVPSAEVDPEREAHEGVITEFFSALRENRLPETHAADNIHSLAMVTESIRSAEARRPVTIDPGID